MTSALRGAIFDVDGVLVDSPHERAWRDALEELMRTDWSDIAADTTFTPGAFTPEVYRSVVAGKPRLGGALAALEYFGVPDAERRAEVYSARKQRMVLALIAAGEFGAYPDALRFTMAVRDRGIRLAAASSSKNVGLMLRRIRLRPDMTLLDAFDVDVSGRDVARGKPDPEIFLAAASELGIVPSSCFVVEDAVAGIAAARAGGMATVGVARADEHDELRDAGADLVVATLDEVDVEELASGRLCPRGAA